MNFKPTALKIVLSILIPLIAIMYFLDIRFNTAGLIYFLYSGLIYFIIGFLIVYIIYSFFQKKK